MMDMGTKDELMRDFNEGLSKIDFYNYNPMSQEFGVPLFVGLMMMVMDKYEDKQNKSNDEIGEEIYGSKKYLQRYLDTNDEMFKSMSEDELKHARYLIKMAYNEPVSNEEKMGLDKYESMIQQVESQIRRG